MPTYLISHSARHPLTDNSNGNPAQMAMAAKTAKEAEALFTASYPQRVLTVIVNQAHARKED